MRVVLVEVVLGPDVQIRVADQAKLLNALADQVLRVVEHVHHDRPGLVHGEGVEQLLACQNRLGDVHREQGLTAPVAPSDLSKPAERDQAINQERGLRGVQVSRPSQPRSPWARGLRRVYGWGLLAREEGRGLCQAAQVTGRVLRGLEPVAYVALLRDSGEVDDLDSYPRRVEAGRDGVGVLAAGGVVVGDDVDAFDLAALDRIHIFRLPGGRSSERSSNAKAKYRKSVSIFLSLHDPQWLL